MLLGLGGGVGNEGKVPGQTLLDSAWPRKEVGRGLGAGGPRVLGRPAWVVSPTPW